ncbi:MAG: class II aldolase/adducin family protein [Ignavibacteria bacterium]
MPERKDLVEICHRVYEKGFVSAYDGNLSLRLAKDRILITPSAKCKGEVEMEDLLEIDIFGNLLAGKGKVTTEAKIHLLVYSKRPEVNAVVHCHPIYATAFASTRGDEYSSSVFPEVILTMGRVPLCKYGTPSTDELPDSLLPYIQFSWAMLLENHGAVTLGASIKDSYFKMEKLEHSAKTLFIARMLGGEKTLTGGQVQKLYAIAEDTYGINIAPENRI